MKRLIEEQGKVPSYQPSRLNSPTETQEMSPAEAIEIRANISKSANQIVADILSEQEK